ncbi:putative metal-binding motif-containing protein, partial [Formosa maritima]
MKKLFFTLLFSTFFIKIAIAQNCVIPNQPGYSFGLSYEISDPVNCNSGSVIYLFQFVSDLPFSLNFIIEDITVGSSTSHSITGTYESIEYYTADSVITLINGHLYKFYWEYSEPGYYCKRFAGNWGISECSDIDEDNDGFAADIDCNDNNANDIPFGNEYCDGYDNNCNGLIDDADPAIVQRPLWFLDEDNDGFPLEGSGIQTCFQPAENYFIYNISNPTPDCDDTDPNVNPDATEIQYNGLDDDCNPGSLDDDLDRDGFLQIEDCDDSNPNVNPDVTEIPNNGIDDDCNPTTPDTINPLDIDDDGDGQTENEGDCDDTNPNIYAGNTEIQYNGL